MCSHWLYSTFWASCRRKSYFYDILLSTSVGVENICVFFLYGDISGDAGNNAAGFEGVHDGYGFG